MDGSVWEYVVWGFVLVSVVVGALIAMDYDKARRLQIGKRELEPFGFVHLPPESTAGRKSGFSFLLPRAWVTFHFRRREAKGPEEHFVEMVESRGDDGDFIYSVLAQRHDGLSLPVFILRPENLLDTVAAGLGMGDIDLPGPPEFSARFHLSGNDRRAVRGLFRGQLAATLAHRRRWWISGGGEWLMLHRRRRIRTDEIGDFVRDARTLAHASVESAKRGPEGNLSLLRPANLMPDPAPPKTPEKGA